ncbi:MAG: hypothetical protein NVS4B5_02320 [Vulcanimicrobiaceae bacterium]
MLPSLAACSDSPVTLTPPPTPRTVEMTWFSIANWYLKIGSLGFMMDGYITRVPQALFYGGGGGLAYTRAAFPANRTDVTTVQQTLAKYGSIDYILAGHSHFDHTYDTAIWQQLTGATIIGGLSTRYQAEAYGVKTSSINVVNGHEKLVLAPGVTMYVVRFNHSGTHTTNPEQHDPIELARPPTPDATNGGFHAGVAEDYPNGGGGRAFLFKIENPNRTLSFFIQDSASPADLTQDIVVDGVDYGAPLANLQAAMTDAGLTSVDAWIATTQPGLAALVVPVIKPKTYIPSHWDGLYAPFFDGIPFPFQLNATESAYLASQNIPVLPQTQYFDRYVLDVDGSVRKNTASAIKAQLGFERVRHFDRETLAYANAGGFLDAPTCCG